MTNNGANLGFEKKLWAAADKMRSNMDAAEYKHVVLGLIFLKFWLLCLAGIVQNKNTRQNALLAMRIRWINSHYRTLLIGGRLCSV